MKRTIIFVVLVLVALAAWYGWKELTRKNKDLESEKAVATVNATDLITAFEKDSASANKLYVDKIIAVKGRVKNVNADGNPIVISLGEEGQMSSVQCSMDSTHAGEYKAIVVGSNATIKGMCTGALTEEMFGTDVKLNRCVVEKQ
jgi:hypothetical protein